MDEEKTIDEAVEEPADEMKEIEPVTFDDIIKDEPAKETAPVLRALGDPDPADPNMIHKHLDNFLAMLCGETPIDDNVRTSTEYWLKRLAGGLGGSTKKIYFHPIVLSSTVTGSLYFLILDNESTPYDTQAKIYAKFRAIAQAIGDTARIGATGAVVSAGTTIIVSHADVRITNEIILYGFDTTGVLRSVDISNTTFVNVFDGVNAIN